MEDTTLQRLLTKLKRRSRFEAKDEAALLALPYTLKALDPGNYLVRQGERADFTCVLLTGFAYRQKIVGDGGRQIIALQVPGDAVDLERDGLISRDKRIVVILDTARLRSVADFEAAYLHLNLLED